MSSARNQPHKKFGKGVHTIKLQPPPPPPIASLSFSKISNATNRMKALNSKDKLFSSGNNSNTKSNQDKALSTTTTSATTTTTTTTGGLLLLSTKKSIMDRNLNNSNGKNASSLDNHKHTNKGISTHDALMNALNGDCGNITKEKIPLAWGLKAPPNNNPPPTTTAAATIAATTTAAATIATTAASSNRNGDTGNDGRSQSQTDHCKIDNYTYSHSHSEQIVKPTPTTSTYDAIHTIKSNISNINSNNNSTKLDSKPHLDSKQQDSPAPAPAADDQVEFMKKLAKERAEKRRQEEEERVLMQKQKAKQRLLELELKLGKHSHSQSKMEMDHASDDHAGLHGNAHGHVHGRQVEGVMQESQQVELMQKEKISRFSDPSRTYSSLLGGGGRDGNTTTSNQHQHQHQHQQSYSRSHLSPGEINTTATSASMSASNMIQLNSYDDRDRGGRSAGSGPRMLFDPKSGSMVAVSSNSTKDKKSKMKLQRNNNMAMADKGNMQMQMDDEEDEEDNFEGGSGSSRRKSSARVRQRAAKRNAKREERTPIVKPRRGPTVISEGHSSIKKGRVLPRTCGVLYKRDDVKGQFVSADGCEGDQGYGAHSVPGGRTRNAKGYSALKLKGRALGKQGKNNSTAAFNPNPSTDNFEVPVYHDQHAQAPAGVASSSGDYDYNRGLNRSHFMRKSQNQPIADFVVNVSAEVSSSVLDVVTGDEKLDLFAGLDASPKLQATAAAWAPSKAVLALAAANLYPPQDIDSVSHDDISESGVHAMSAMALIDNESTHDADVGHAEASPSIGLGLGFDPSTNMDSLMMSPAMEDETPSDIPGLSTFDLKESSALPTSSSNPFLNTTSILGSSPWGASAGNINTMGALSNWDLLGSGNKGVEEEIQKNQSPSAFLSLGVGGGQNTWGGNGTSSAFSGFSGIDSPSSMGSSDSQKQASS